MNLLLISVDLLPGRGWFPGGVSDFSQQLHYKGLFWGLLPRRCRAHQKVPSSWHNQFSKASAPNRHTESRSLCGLAGVAPVQWPAMQRGKKLGNPNMHGMPWKARSAGTAVGHNSHAPASFPVVHRRDASHSHSACHGGVCLLDTQALTLKHFKDGRQE